MTSPASSPASPVLFCFGLGYTALALARRLRMQGWRLAGTTTRADKVKRLRAAGIDARLFGPGRPLADPVATFRDVTHMLISIPPGRDGDQAFDFHSGDIAAAPNLRWLGYLSAASVYGNRDGEWVDENSLAAPASRRGDLRLRAEEHWQGLYLTTGAPLHIFRLAGIYGPGRSALDSVRASTARRIHKPGHAFNRMHIDDVVTTLEASMAQPQPGETYNLTDDVPAPSADVIAEACRLLDLPEPPLIDYDKADLAPMVRSFYKDNKRIRNEKIKTALGVRLRHADYKSGLAACLLAESAAAADEADAILRDLMIDSLPGGD